MKIDPKLRQFATPTQLRILAAIEKATTMREAADSLSVTTRSIQRAMQRLRESAAIHGYAPEAGIDHPVPKDQMVSGYSTLYDETGDVKLRWVKSKADQNRLQEWAEAVAESIATSIKAKKPTAAPKTNLEDIMVTYPIGDAHFGLYSWIEETGEEWNLEKATQILTESFRILVKNSAKSKTALIANLGDWTHTDNQENRTSRSKNALDVDGRWHQLVKVASSSFVSLINIALTHHEEVHVINEIGNHDDHTAYLISLMLEAHYRNEPRVTIDTSPGVFHKYRFGKNLIAVHHGHLAKPERLYGVMTQDWREDWGECKFGYWLVGHIHHRSVIEIHGVPIESFRTLAAKDAYHHAAGYRAGRDITSITFHKEYGEVSRQVVGIEMAKENLEL